MDYNTHSGAFLHFPASKTNKSYIKKSTTEIQQQCPEEKCSASKADAQNELKFYWRFKWNSQTWQLQLLPHNLLTFVGSQKSLSQHTQVQQHHINITVQPWAAPAPGTARAAPRPSAGPSAGRAARAPLPEHGWVPGQPEHRSSLGSSAPGSEQGRTRHLKLQGFPGACNVWHYF